MLWDLTIPTTLSLSPPFSKAKTTSSFRPRPWSLASVSVTATSPGPGHLPRAKAGPRLQEPSRQEDTATSSPPSTAALHLKPQTSAASTPLTFRAAPGSVEGSRPSSTTPRLASYPYRAISSPITSMPLMLMGMEAAAPHVMARNTTRKADRQGLDRALLTVYASLTLPLNTATPAGPVRPVNLSALAAGIL